MDNGDDYLNQDIITHYGRAIICDIGILGFISILPARALSCQSQGRRAFLVLEELYGSAGQALINLTSFPCARGILA